MKNLNAKTKQPGLVVVVGVVLLCTPVITQDQSSSKSYCELLGNLEYIQTTDPLIVFIQAAFVKISFELLR